MDKYEIFAELLAEQEIAEQVLPTLFQNGFDEWEIVKELNNELLTQMNITEEILQNKILECIQKADCEDQNEQSQEEESKQEQTILTIEPQQQKIIQKIEQEKLITIQDLLKATSKKRETGESDIAFLSSAAVLSLNDKKITKITNIDLCPGLKTLHLFQNFITKIECLDMLCNLTTLHLENNMIAKMEGFGKLYLLEKLYLNKNCISCLEGLENQQFLRELQISNQNIGNIIFTFDEGSLVSIGQSIFQLDLDNSNVQTIQHFQHLEKLIILKIRNNKIGSFESFLDPLSHMRSLQELDLRGNQICKIPKYRDRFVLMSKSLEQLDEKKILPKEREFLLALWKKKHGMMGAKDEVKELPVAEKLKKLGKLDGKSIRQVSKNEYQNPKTYQRLNSGSDFHSNTITTNQKHSIQTHGAPGKQKIL